MCMGDMGSSKDIWTMPDKPAADEVATYLMGIADDTTETKQQHQGDEQTTTTEEAPR